MISPITKLRSIIKEKDIDAFFVTNPDNRRYLTNFTGSAGYVFISKDAALLATDFRYVEQANQQCKEVEVVKMTGNFEWFAEILSRLNIKTLGFESQDVTVGSYNNLTKILSSTKSLSNVRFIPTIDIIEEVRSIKASEEISIISKTALIADEALLKVAPTLESGNTESEIAWKIEKAMRENGADAMSFDIIVASGPNAALPHHQPSDRAVNEGETIVVDMGARYKGYCSDMTRTFCIGTPDSQLTKVYDTVLGAQLTAISTAAVGMTGSEVDALARNVINNAGYGEQFGHSLGHGVGLAVHEQPVIGPSSKTILEENMVFTVEPGIYISGWGGVRIEDMVVLDGGKARELTSLSKKENPKDITITNNKSTNG